MTASRLPTGGTHIDRSTSIAFEFDGRTLTGFAGDTIASALLANGVDVVGRSIYHDRPRGIVSAGPEEPNALVQVRWPDGASEPMLPATTVMLQEGMAVSSLWPGAGRARTAGRGTAAIPAGSTAGMPIARSWSSARASPAAGPRRSPRCPTPRTASCSSTPIRPRRATACDRG